MSRRSAIVLCPNMSSNALGRALVLAELLEPEWDVRIAGPLFGADVWAPLRSRPVPLDVLPLGRAGRLSGSLPGWTRKRLSGAAGVWISKPLAESLGAALRAGLDPRRALMDIDDWESGFFQLDSSRPMGALELRLARARSAARRFGLNSFVLVRALEAIAARLPNKTVSNRWLGERFGGGLIVPHARETEVFDRDSALPVPPLPPGRLWVGFVGTPRPHKGIDVLIDALAGADSALGLALIGCGRGGEASALRAARVLGGERVHVEPEFPFEELPARLSRVPLVAIPSLRVPSALGQLPAKLFDAMALAKPIVASDLNDLPSILEGCGRIVPAGSSEALSVALSELASSPSERARLGRAARDKFVTSYSYDAIRASLLPLAAKVFR